MHIRFPHALPIQQRKNSRPGKKRNLDRPPKSFEESAAAKCQVANSRSAWKKLDTAHSFCGNHAPVSRLSCDSASWQMINTDMGSRLEKTARVVVAIVCAITASLLMSGVASAGPAPITVSLPTATFDTSVPIATVIIEPVVTTFIDASLNYVGFQGDFTFDETVVTFSTPFVVKTGLTSNNWSLSGNILPGAGPIRTMRISAFSLDFTPLNGSGTLFGLRMLRVSSTPGAMSPLAWKPDPDNFIFIDADLNTHTCSTPPGSITIAMVCNLTEGFNVITTLVPGGWFMQNNSQPGPGTTGWFQGSTAAFPSQSGAANSYIAANYDNGTGTSTLSNWLLTPPVNLQNGAQFTFWTRTMDAPAYADRLQVRMSTNGTSSNVGSTATDVGDFTTLLLDINPTYTLTGYPNAWTQFTVTVSGLGSPTTGRLAFRYFVENGGPTGTNSDYIGIDTVQYACGPAPTPTPTANANADTDTDQHIWHYLLLLESSPWPSAKCDAHSKW